MANITEKDLNDVLEVRIALENLSIQKACSCMTEEQLEKLWEAARKFESMTEGRESGEAGGGGCGFSRGDLPLV